jgi:peptidoglycan/xylan/chitin deacetylase (PgdA/CDA1 family)
VKKISEFIKEIIAFIFRLSGFYILIREVFCKNKATIILYHNPTPELFKKHVEYLSKHYTFISLDRLVNAINNKQASDLPAKSLVVTIDDGFKENYLLLEIFKSYNICPTIYLCSHIVNTKRKLWFSVKFSNLSKLKRYTNGKRLKALEDGIDYLPKKEYQSRQSLSLEEINEMSRYVDFQSHSKFHPILITCSDMESQEEIEGSKYYLEKLLNKKIEHFCFPNGDYSAREIEYVKKCDYKSARILDIGWNDNNSNPYKLKSMGIQDDATINILCAQICGFFGYLRFLRHGSLMGKHPPFA